MPKDAKKSGKEKVVSEKNKGNVLGETPVSTGANIKTRRKVEFEDIRKYTLRSNQQMAGKAQKQDEPTVTAEILNVNNENEKRDDMMTEEKKNVSNVKVVNKKVDEQSSKTKDDKDDNVKETEEAESDKKLKEQITENKEKVTVRDNGANNKNRKNNESDSESEDGARNKTDENTVMIKNMMEEWSKKWELEKRRMEQIASKMDKMLRTQHEKEVNEMKECKEIIKQALNGYECLNCKRYADELAQIMKNAEYERGMWYEERENLKAKINVLEKEVAVVNKGLEKEKEKQKTITGAGSVSNDMQQKTGQIYRERSRSRNKNTTTRNRDQQTSTHRSGENNNEIQTQNSGREKRAVEMKNTRARNEREIGAALNNNNNNEERQNRIIANKWPSDKPKELTEEEWQSEKNRRARRRNNICIRFKEGEHEEAIKTVENRIKISIERKNVRIGYKNMVIVYFDSLVEKKAVLLNRAELKGTNVYIDDDSTEREVQVQRWLRDIVHTEREKGNEARASYMKVCVNNEWHKWDEKRGKLIKEDERYV
ncbi:putative uncharacterized protein DDB_G0274405 [Microplitis mediator]|uniref:putative uncharacterized protein DDB_G0274405 n=1 Tax=Microplitis mediator TaxID=375433 RepID=UPI002555A6EF|nr:putative uncharacterized protein DDB_G0274405 [Microplitis mediator]